MCGSLDSSRFATRTLCVFCENHNELGIHYLRKGGTSQIFGNNRNKYLSTTLTSQNWMHAEIKSRLMSGNACCHSVQNFLSSGMLSTNVNIKIYRNIILPFVCMGVNLGRSH